MCCAAARVRSSALGQRWEYLDSVVDAEAWPRARWTVTTSQPEAINPEGVEVPQVVPADTGHAGGRGGCAPAVADGFLLWRLGAGASERAIRRSGSRLRRGRQAS